jgi:hypothetical protein
MGETRINLKHLLEDIRDSYPFPIEEAIITELVANALDANASEIHFFTDPEHQILKCMDNGQGMKSKELEEYHDIAATSKRKGEGIGFAGVGAKLALLIAQWVITETKSDQFHKATKWYLESDQRAPWDYTNAFELANSSRGTAVTIVLRDKKSPLLNEGFIKQAIQTHFYPLLDEEFMSEAKKIYLAMIEVKFFVNREKVQLPKAEYFAERKIFPVRLGKGRRDKFIGIGFLSKSDKELTEGESGIAISTRGKVIKRGWDWIGITPRNPRRLAGLVEIHDLVEILTTNKADFLKDNTSYQKQLRYRKAIQEAMKPILYEFGEISQPRESLETDLRPLEREIERVLENMSDEFPELSSLLGRRRRAETIQGVIPDLDAPPIGTEAEGVEVMTGSYGGFGEGSGIEAAPGSLLGQRIEPSPEPIERGKLHEGRRKRPGLMIGFEDDPNRHELAWLSGDGVYINKSHPAYQRAADKNYHIVISVAWALSEHIGPEKSSRNFINQFLSLWGVISR